MENIIKAINIAIKARDGQLGKLGQPYVLHPLWVMGQVDSEDEKIAAVLHDVVEDTSVTISELRAQGFSDASMTALELLTHDKTIPYMDYINKLAPNKIARRVKLADLAHNMDINRLQEVSPGFVARAADYKKAYGLLKNYA